VLDPIAVPKVAALVGGGCRVYYTTSGGPTGIASASSADGLTFMADAGLRLAPVPSAYAWGDPNVVVTGSTYLMSSTQIPNDNSFSSIWLSSSADGLTWTTSAAPVITSTAGSPVDSSFVPLADGGLRVYYGLFVGTSAVPTGNVQSEISAAC